MKLYGHLIDMECIYCKYSQFALKESAKVTDCTTTQESGNKKQNYGLKTPEKI